MIESDPTKKPQQVGLKKLFASTFGRGTKKQDILSDEMEK